MYVPIRGSDDLVCMFRRRCCIFYTYRTSINRYHQSIRTLPLTGRIRSIRRFRILNFQLRQQPIRLAYLSPLYVTSYTGKPLSVNAVESIISASVTGISPTIVYDAYVFSSILSLLMIPVVPAPTITVAVPDVTVPS